MDMHPLLQVLFQFAFYYPMVMAFFWMTRSARRWHSAIRPTTR